MTRFGSVTLLLAVALFLVPVFSALAQDTDADGMSDAYENTYGCLMPNTVDDGVDYDSDGMTSGEEFVFSYMLDPCDVDTDDDNVHDYGEVFLGSNPISEDIVPELAIMGTATRITNNSSESNYQSIVWNGYEFGLVWQDQRDGNNEIYFTRISTIGDKICSDIRITFDAGSSDIPSITWTGSEYGVVWGDDRSTNYETYFSRLSPLGDKLISDTRISFGDFTSGHQNIAWSGTEFGVSYEDGRDGNAEIYFSRISPLGARIGAEQRISNSIGVSTISEIIWSGSEWAIRWHDDRSGTNCLYFAMVSPTGSLILPEKFIAETFVAAWTQGISFNGTDYYLSYINGSNAIFLQRLSAAGDLLGSPVIVSDSSGSEAQPFPVYSAPFLSIIWRSNRDGNTEIYFGVYNDQLIKLLPEKRITNNSSTSWYPSLEWTGTEYGLTWYDNETGNNEIYFQRLQFDQDGDNAAIIDELAFFTDVSDWDTDDDYVSDGTEIIHGCMAVLDQDTDDDGLIDGGSAGEDLNSNGILDPGETDPCNPDTDNGGEPDGPEIDGGRDPNDPYDDLIPPTDLFATPLNGALIKCAWNPSPSPSAVLYNLYWDAGTGVMDWVTPLAVVPVGQPLEYTTGPLVVGQRYWFGIRVQIAGGAEDQNATIVSAVPFNDSAGKVQACIKHPGTGHKFNGNLLLVKAEICVGDRVDVSQVLLQWRPAGETVWSDVPAADGRPNPDPDHPYFAHWDVTGLANGDYELRAVAYDLSLVPDPDAPVSQFRVEQNHTTREMNQGGNGKPESKGKAYANIAQEFEVVDPGQDSPSELSLPPGVLSQNTMVEFGIEDPADHAGQVNASQYKNPESFLRVSLENGQTILAGGQKATLSFPYQDDDDNGIVDGTDIEVSELWPHTWNAGASRWEPLTDIQFDAVKKTVSGKTGHFSLFALLDDRDNDHDGLLDQDEDVWTTDRNNWDTDGDHLPDGWETTQASGSTVFHPLDGIDGTEDFDLDGIANTHEYWNGSDPWGADPVPQPGFDVGCYYWGKSDGGPYVQPGDITKMQMAYVGASVDYSKILPGSYDPMDLDRSTVPDPADITLAQYMYAEANRPGGYASSPAALSLEDAPVSAIAVGDTTHVTVSVHAQGPGTELYSPGMGVVFWVESGNAALLGGEGTDPGEAAGNRYDVSMEAAGGALANVVVLVTGPGPVVVNAKVPACGVEPVGRWCGEVVLPAAVVINP